MGQDEVTPDGLITGQIKLKIVFAGEAATNDNEAAVMDEKDVETFEFDEDGNLMDGSNKAITKAFDDQTGIPIHCPLYPKDKHPHWWVLVTNRQNTGMIAAPVKVHDLVGSKTVTVQFAAPSRPGNVLLNIHVKSDSLIGVDAIKEASFKVVPQSSNPVETKWDISGDESDDQTVPFGREDD